MKQEGKKANRKSLLFGRRKFLSISLCQTFLPTILSILPKSVTAEGHAATYAMLNSILVNSGPAIVVGKSYLNSQTWAVGEARKFIRDVPMQFLGSSWTSNADKKAFKHWFKTRINQDFSNGDMVQIDGWLASRTEAAYCAALADLHSKVL